MVKAQQGKDDALASLAEEKAADRHSCTHEMFVLIEREKEDRSEWEQE